jgi:hypothetical protein
VFALGADLINLRADTALRQGINTPRAYTGPIRNKTHTGLDDGTYKALWDEVNPNDPLKI